MKNITHKNLLILLIFSIGLISCVKSLDKRISLFVVSYNNAKDAMLEGNPFIKSTSAEKTAEKEITIRFYTDFPPNENGKTSIIKSIPELFALALKEDRDAINLLTEDIYFRVRILDENGQNLLYSENIDKKYIENFDKADTEKNTNNLSNVIEVLNKNISNNADKNLNFIKIEAGKNNDIIYSIEVSNNSEKLINLKNSEENLKTELINNSKLKEVIPEMILNTIFEIKYRFYNKNGTLIKEITITQDDLLKN